MQQIDLADALTGPELERRLTEKVVHEPIIEGLLYKNASLMLSSQPGLGKSCISIQAAMEMAGGVPVFGGLFVPRPQRVWYIQMERPDIESLERIQDLSKHINLVSENIYLDTSLQVLNFLRQEHFDAILLRGKLINPDVVIIDPLYGIATGLSNDEVASSLAKMLTHFKKELDCALWINHHTTKNTHEVIEGKKVQKDDPFYGAQWLKAHVTGSYLISSIDEDGSGTKWTRKKNSHGNLLKNFTLNFDPSSYYSAIKNERGSAHDRIKLYVNTIARKSGKKTFNINEIALQTDLSFSVLKKHLWTGSISEHLKCHSSNGSKTLYEVLTPIP